MNEENEERLTERELYLDAYVHRIRIEKEIADLHVSLELAREREVACKGRLKHPVDAQAHFAELKARKENT